MFPLTKRKIGGFVFKQLYPKSFGTLYNHPHLGVDYSANVGDKLYAPFDGKLTTLVGTEGGNTIWFCPDKQDVIIRFMHLSKFLVKSGSRVKEGDLIALTGNTGSATTSAHVHLDISNHKVDIYNINNFVDPEKFKWDTKKDNVSTTNTNVKIELKPTETPNTTLYTLEQKKPQETQPVITQSEIKTNLEPTQPDYLITKPEAEVTGIGEIINLFKDIFNYFKNLKK